MLRYVRASSYSRAEIVEMEIENALDAYNAGYNLEIDPSGSGEFNVIARENRNMMPSFTITPYSTEDDKIVYDVEMSFPNIYLDVNQYADTAEYWMDRWKCAAQLATQIKRLVVDPNADYED